MDDLPTPSAAHQRHITIVSQFDLPSPTSTIRTRSLLGISPDHTFDEVDVVGAQADPEAAQALLV